MSPASSSSSSSSSSKASGHEDSSSKSSSSSTTATTTPQILKRSMVAALIQDLDASDVLECYALVRKAPLQVGSFLNQTLVVSKMALGLRYLPPSNVKSKLQPPKPKLELTLEYGPQRLDNQRESTPLVQHPDLTPASAGGTSSGSTKTTGGGGGGTTDESLFVTWENEGRIYYTQSISTSHYTGAYYMASLTGAVLESILYKAVEYPTLHGHRRYQPFSVYQRSPPQQQQQQQQDSKATSSSSSTTTTTTTSTTTPPPPRLLLKSSSATDFVREMFHHMAQLGVELQPIVAPPMYQLRLWVSAPVEKLQVGVTTPAAMFYTHFYQCLHALVTGDYSHYTPTAAPTISAMPSTVPTVSPAPTTNAPSTVTQSLYNESAAPTTTNVTPVYIDDDDNWFNNTTLRNATDSKKSNTQSNDTPANNIPSNEPASTLPPSVNPTAKPSSKPSGGSQPKSASTPAPSSNTSNASGTKPINNNNKKPTIKSTNTNQPAGIKAQNATKSNGSASKNATTKNATRFARFLSQWNRKMHVRLGKTAETNNNSSRFPSVAPSAAPSSTPPQEPSSSVDTAQKAAEEAKEAAKVAHNAAKQNDEQTTASAAEKAATAAQKAADATYSAANQHAREGLLSGDGDLMASILASTCFTNPQYEITKRVEVVENATTLANATASNRTTTTTSTTLAYLYIDGSFYYRLKMTSPYIDLVRVHFDMPPATVVGSIGNHVLPGSGSGGDVLDWALTFLIIVAVLLGITITLQAIGFRIYRPLLKCQRRFFHPQKYMKNITDHDDSERGDFDDRGFDFDDDDDDDDSIDDAIPTSMGGKRTSWMLRGNQGVTYVGASPPRSSSSRIRDQSQGSGNYHRNNHNNNHNNNNNNIDLDEYDDDHHHDDTTNLKVVEMTPLNGADQLLARTSSHHSSRRRLSSSCSRSSSMSLEDRLRDTDVPTRFSRDPDLVDLPHLKSMSKVAVPASLVTIGHGNSMDADN